VERQYVGIDFHHRRSVIVRMSATGERLSVLRVPNEALAIANAMADAGPEPQVVIEATYRWYWVVDMLQELGATVHLANPKALNWGDRRVKNDVPDATDLADMLRLHRLPEAWIAPPAIRELRELVRYRAKLVKLRTGLKAQVHAVMAKEGVLPTVADMFCAKGNAQLDAMELAPNYGLRVESLRDLIAIYDREVAMLERKIHHHLCHHPGYRAIQAINGVGRTIAAIAVAEIGDVERFSSPEALCCWTGLTPKQRESDTKAHREGISKGLAPVALGPGGGHRPLPRWPQVLLGLPPHRRAPGYQPGPGGGGAQDPHAHLLRPARRRDPLPGAGESGVRVRTRPGC
jgi:transposase